MIDPRWIQLAEILVHYSTMTVSNDRVLITMRETSTWPLLCAVYEKTIKAGAFPYVEFKSSKLERSLMLHGSNEQLKRVPKPRSFGMDWADVYIGR